MNYYPRNIGDYIGATAHLTMIEDGAYNRLMDWYYLDEQPIPNDKRAIYRRCRAQSDVEREAVDTILDEFFSLDADAFRHSRIDEEIAKFKDKAGKAQKAAKTRWNADASKKHANASQSNANASNKDADGVPLTRKPDAMPTNNQETITKKQETKSRERAKRLDVKQLPDDWRTFCSAQAPHLDPGETFNRFRDYWIAQPGQKGVKLDWTATWRNWCRNEKPTNRDRAAQTMTPAAKQRQSFVNRISGGIHEPTVIDSNGNVI